MANPLFHGIEALVLYDPTAGSGEQAAVLFKDLDAELSNIQIGGVVEGDRQDVWGNAFFPGSMAEMNVEALDPGGALLTGLKTWYDADKSVAAVALQSNGQSVIHWTETNRIHQPQATSIRALVSGRSDFTKFSMRRHGGEHKIYRTINAVSHLDPINTTGGNQVRNAVLPFPGKTVTVGLTVAEVSGQTFSSANNLIVYSTDASGGSLGSSTLATALGRMSVTYTLPSTSHTLYVITPGTNATFTISDLSVRFDGSADYIDR